LVVGACERGAGRRARQQKGDQDLTHNSDLSKTYTSCALFEMSRCLTVSEPYIHVWRPRTGVGGDPAWAARAITFLIRG
jgi:hypothetical protein